jgi:hypothetical protein
MISIDNLFKISAQGKDVTERANLEGIKTGTRS